LDPVFFDEASRAWRNPGSVRGKCDLLEDDLVTRQKAPVPGDRQSGNSLVVLSRPAPAREEENAATFRIWNRPDRFPQWLLRSLLLFHVLGTGLIFALFPRLILFRRDDPKNGVNDCEHNDLREKPYHSPKIENNDIYFQFPNSGMGATPPGCQQSLSRPRQGLLEGARRRAGRPLGFPAGPEALIPIRHGSSLRLGVG
jgi:hypothetical protein